MPQLLRTARLILLLAFVTSLSIAPDRYAHAQQAGQELFDPVGLFLTWQQDPTTTMTIDWHTAGETRQPVLEYRRTGETAWQSRPGSSHPFPFAEDGRTIHRTELTGLEPGSDYEFRFGSDSKTYSFRTMPADASRPIRFAAGGDTRHQQDWMEETNRQVLPYDPDFVLIGGDLAYADGRDDRLYRWYEWFDAYKNTLVTPEGWVIPMLVSIGNHEVLGGYYHREDHERREGFPPYAEDDASRARIAPYFYSLFAFPGQPGYGVLDFGDYLSIVLLDTDHTNPIEGAQTRWLEQVLSERQHVPHVFPNYHVPAYPSVRSFDGSTHQSVREHWVPLFERYGLRVVFESHDHAYKRTHPIREGRLDARGIVYIGDGAWGTSPREIGRDNDGQAPWYLAEAASVRHFILATIHGPHQHFLMVDNEGNIIDEYPQVPTPHGATHAIGRAAEAP